MDAKPYCDKRRCKVLSMEILGPTLSVDQKDLESSEQQNYITIKT
jgi:hypothetical protein